MCSVCLLDHPVDHKSIEIQQLTLKSGVFFWENTTLALQRKIWPLGPSVFLPFSAWLAVGGSKKQTVLLGQGFANFFRVRRKLLQILHNVGDFTDRN